MTTYELEWERQRARTDVKPAHLAVHRWYLRLAKPELVEPLPSPRSDVRIVRAVNPSVHFYRYLYHTAGEEFIWGDRRRMSDAELAENISPDHVHVMVLYEDGTPAGFFEMDFGDAQESHIKYFALLPGFLGRGLGRFMLNQAIVYAGQRNLPLILDTCSLDHPSALENYRKRGFEIYREEDEEYPDPRLDGTIRRDAGQHVPLAE